MTPLARNPKFARIAAPLMVGVLVIVVWHALVTLLKVPQYLVPGPVSVARTLVTDWGLLSSSLLVTLKITFLAFACAVVLGTTIAFLFVQSRWIEVSFFPYAVLMQVTPVVAIAPLIIIWVKNPTIALTICATLVALFPIISNTTLGLRSVNPGLLSLFRMNRATRMQTLLRLRIPSALPYFFGGLRISSGLALIGAVVAEIAAGSAGAGSGLAYRIVESQFRLNIPRLFAALALLSITGIVIFLTLSALSHLLLRKWHESALEREN